MGLLDNSIGAVAKQALTNAQGRQAPIQAATKVIASRQGGLEKEVKSRVSTGANLPVDGAGLQSALGAGQFALLAKSLGMSEGQAAGGHAAVRPRIVDPLTPDGQVSQQSMVDQGLKALAGQLLK
jgi:uncharacterized protein YidB (DUF937 family)